MEVVGATVLVGALVVVVATAVAKGVMESVLEDVAGVLGVVRVKNSDPEPESSSPEPEIPVEDAVVVTETGARVVSLVVVGVVCPV